MRTTTFTISLLLCSTLSALSQTKYYTTTKTFYQSGYSYQCDVDGGGLVTLYNKANALTYVPQYDKATRKGFTMDDFTKVIEYDTWTGPRCSSIVSNAFSAEEALRVKGNKLRIALYINSETGKVMEVKFLFILSSSFQTIPISVFRTIELQIKQNIYYIPTAEGKKRNYLFLGLTEEVTK